MTTGGLRIRLCTIDCLAYYLRHGRQLRMCVLSVFVLMRSLGLDLWDKVNEISTAPGLTAIALRGESEANNGCFH